MAYIKAVYLELNQCCDAFIKGVELLEQCAINDSVNFFNRACTSVSKTHKNLPKYQSYYGFSCLLNGEKKAIELCRSAVQLSPFDGDIWLNLARAELFLNNRQAAVNVIKNGLRFSSAHDGLNLLKKNIGVRSKKAVPFFSRNSLVNTVLGKRMRRSR